MLAGSLFSGVGGLDLGLRRAGIDTAFLCESDAWKRSVLAAHWPGAPIHDDVRDVPGSGRVGPIDLLHGGFPCQDLSVAGRRAGLAGERSGLFHEFARITDALRPTWVLLENVPGLASSNDGRDFGVVLGTLAELGYGVAWRVLDARYFGVPQRRRRVFVVGHSGGDPAPALRALCESCEGHPAPRQCSWTRAAAAPGGGAQLVGSLTRGGPAQLDDNAVGGGHVTVADTLTSGSHPGSNMPVRRLTPVECERLMSWPDGWTAPPGVKAPDSRRYAACGDGVVANVAEWIGRGILANHIKEQPDA